MFAFIEDLRIERLYRALCVSPIAQDLFRSYQKYGGIEVIEFGISIMLPGCPAAAAHCDGDPLPWRSGMRTCPKSGK